MAITRRQFIKRTGLTAAATAFGPSLFGSPFVRSALAETIGERYLISIFLDGGNDGFNTIIPYNDGVGNPVLNRLRSAYDQARTNTNVSTGNVSRATNPILDPHTGCEIGFHPGLAALRDMYNQGMVAVLQGCGYPAYSLSHEESRIIWETANPRRLASFNGKGWIGRHLSLEYGPSDIPAVTIDYTIAGELQQIGTSVLAIGNGVENFSFPYDRKYNATSGDFDPDGGIDDVPAKKAALAALFAQAKLGAAPFDGIGISASATLNATEIVPQIAANYYGDSGLSQPDYDGLNRGTGYALRDIAKLIYGAERGQLGPLPPRFFQLRNDGYDLHSNQGGATGIHYNLHYEVAQGLKLFFDDLENLGSAYQDIRDKVLVVVWSEFSRRIRQNDNGTDHGSQAPMLLIGGAGALNGGVYGNHPDVKTALDDEHLTSGDGTDGDGNTAYSQNVLNGFRSTDFRDVYGTILKHWVNMLPGDVATLLPVDGTGDGDNYWEVANFDVGFLP